MRFSVLIEIYCGFAVFGNFSCGFSVSNRPQCPPPQQVSDICICLSCLKTILPACKHNTHKQQKTQIKIIQSFQAYLFCICLKQRIAKIPVARKSLPATTIRENKPKTTANPPHKSTAGTPFRLEFCLNLFLVLVSLIIAQSCIVRQFFKIL